MNRLLSESVRLSVKQLDSQPVVTQGTLRPVARERCAHAHILL